MESVPCSTCISPAILNRIYASVVDALMICRRCSLQCWKTQLLLVMELGLDYKALPRSVLCPGQGGDRPREHGMHQPCGSCCPSITAHTQRGRHSM